MKAILAWILVAILGVGTLLGHQQQADFRERELDKLPYTLGCRIDSFMSEAICADNKERAYKAIANRTTLYFYLPSACLGLAALFALFVSLKPSRPAEANG